MGNNILTLVPRSALAVTHGCSTGYCVEMKVATVTGREGIIIGIFLDGRVSVDLGQGLNVTQSTSDLARI